MSLLSWQAGTAGGSFIIGVFIQSILIAYRPTYSPHPYQGTLFVFAVALFIGLINTVGARHLPTLQNIVIFPHALGWIAVMAFMWALGPRASAKDVFTTFSSNGGWENMGLSVMVGQ